jgi:hypothetical protein
MVLLWKYVVFLVTLGLLSKLHTHTVWVRFWGTALVEKANSDVLLPAAQQFPAKFS